MPFRPAAPAPCYRPSRTNDIVVVVGVTLLGLTVRETFVAGTETFMVEALRGQNLFVEVIPYDEYPDTASL